MSKGKRILVAGLFSNLTTSSYLDNDYRASVIGVNPDHIVEYRKSRRSTLKMDIVEDVLVIIKTVNFVRNIAKIMKKVNLILVL